MSFQCPICKRPVVQGKPYFPFCSERCKLIDLGRWLDGKYQIPVEPADDQVSHDDSDQEHGSGA